MAEPMSAKCLSEFIGTFMLVFTVGCNVLAGNAAWAATSIACVLMVCIYALGGVSGANFNPAVSLALGLSNKLPWMDVAIYIAVQLSAGCVAGLAYYAMLQEAFRLEPAKGFGWAEAGAAEVLYTFMLCFVVLNTAASNQHAGKNQFYGLAIGFVIVAGGYGAGHISGGCFNPAVAAGIDVSGAVAGKGGPYWCAIYAVFEVIGACLAAGAFRLCRPDDFGQSLVLSEDGSPTYSLGSRLLSEALGTYFLVLTVGLNVLGGSAAAVWSIAASLMCMIYALGSCSGAHFNPAVTFAVVLSGRGKCKVQDGAAYVCVQIIAGILAAYTYSAMEHGKTFPLQAGPGYGWAHVAAAEIVFTFLLAFVVLNVATTKTPLADFFGLAIGSCVTAGGFAIGSISGGSLNPAVSFGISSSQLMNGGHFWHCLVYSVFELVGAGLAAGAFMVCRPAEYAKGSLLTK